MPAYPQAIDKKAAEPAAANDARSCVSGANSHQGDKPIYTSIMPGHHEACLPHLGDAHQKIFPADLSCPVSRNAVDVDVLVQAAVGTRSTQTVAGFPENFMCQQYRFSRGSHLDTKAREVGTLSEWLKMCTHLILHDYDHLVLAFLISNRQTSSLIFCSGNMLHSVARSQCFRIV